MWLGSRRQCSSWLFHDTSGASRQANPHLEDEMSATPRVLESHIDWRATDVSDPNRWTVRLDDNDHRELDEALIRAKSISHDLLEVDRDAFPLPTLSPKLAEIERQLIEGRGFVRLSGLAAERYCDDDLTLLYWGIGLHLGDPWPQNKAGLVMGDVTDQGRRRGDPTSRGNEVGLVGLDYHTDGSDLVGLLCLRKAKSGGLSCVANAVAIHNELVRTRPEVVHTLSEPLPWDLRGRQPAGAPGFYMRPVFTDYDDRLFVHFVPGYIRASQRHPAAPRLSPAALEALDIVSGMARNRDFNVYMDLEPGDMQFINNYHVLHGRTPYQDDMPNGYKRHLKRLWLASRRLEKRPPRAKGYWGKERCVSRIAAVGKPRQPSDAGVAVERHAGPRPEF
jgi:hypothetical protein